MTRSRLRLAGTLLALAAGGCTEGDSLTAPGIQPPDAVTATALNQASIRVEWTPGDVATLERYRILRRQDLKGPFHTLAEVDPNSTTYFDTGLEAGTFYGYRIVALSRLGEPSAPSTVAGARTAPRPGLRVLTGLTGGTTADLADPNGYRLVVTGPRDTTVSLGTIGELVITPLPAGSYTLTLQDVLSTCTVTNGLVRTVEVADTGLNTRSIASFIASCLDPSRGSITVIAEVAGDSVDPDGYRVDYAGIIAGDTLPALGGGVLNGEGDTLTFTNLRPGDYQVSLGDVEPPCTPPGNPTADVAVEPLSADTVRFLVTCADRGGGDPNAPFVFRNVWSPQAAPQGQTVTLEITLDGSADPSQTIGAVQAELRYDATRLSYQSASSPSPVMNNITVNSGTPGVIVWGNFTTQAQPPTGVVPAARFTFQVTGASGTVNTRSAIQTIADGDFSVVLDTLFRVVEDTLTIGSGGGGGNQSPTAEAGGPYSGTTGNAVSFSSAGSTDPDGSITGYSWSFGDGGTSTQPNPSHSYASAGSFTATLTVTDNQGATGTDQATVTISGGGGNQPPVAQAGGPYSGTVGNPIGFTAAGSVDPDGAIASYSWSFGDGGTSTQPNPSHSYASAGSYTATLTVTDNQGATGTDQASVTVSSGSGTPFSWLSAFGAFEQALGTYPLVISLNLTQDIAQTPGPEALGSYAVDSLVWDPAVLRYHSLTFGSGGGSFNTTDAVGGCKCKLVFSGVPTANTGVVTVATVRFTPLGGSGAHTTTATTLGPVLSTAALGSFNYRTLIQVTEGSLTLP